jgi:glycerophosphoryl diester phosphodiesterase
MPRIVAHRGDCRSAPENTLAAFAAALQGGADAVELDVHLSRDGVAFVHHDLYFGRTASGSGYVGEKSIAEITSCDVGGERVPLLRDVLALGKSKLKFEIELKEPSLSLLHKVVREFESFGLAEEVEITSEHLPLLCRAKEIYPSLRTGTWFRPFPQWMSEVQGKRQILDYAALMRLQVIHLPASLLTSNLVSELQTEGYVVHGANLDSEEEISLGISAGIDQLSTNELERAVAIRKARIENSAIPNEPHA